MHVINVKYCIHLIYYKNVNLNLREYLVVKLYNLNTNHVYLQSMIVNNKIVQDLHKDF